MKKIKLLLLIPFIFLSVKSNAQSQVGNTVYNSNNDKNFGGSVSINAQGNIVAVAADKTNTVNGDGSGLVRVFELNNTTNQWEQKGNDILGDNYGDIFGSSISINSTGNILAIGAPLNDSDDFQSGVVKVFEFNNSNNQWEQKGSNIYNGKPDYFTGNSVDLNSLGTRIVIGTPIGTGGSGDTRIGNIVVFDFDSNSNDWVQVGSTIIGTQNYVNLGFSVALNNSGDIFVAGGPGVYTNGSPVNGIVKVYELINNNWVQKGNDILGNQTGSMFGSRVDINNNGNIIIIGALLNDENGNDSGKVSIYTYDGSEWIQKGASVLGDAEDRLGGNVKIDNVGDKILIGSGSYDNNLGKVELFDFSNNNWETMGDSILGDSTSDHIGSSISMTSDGNYIVSGTSRSNDVTNYFKVYETSNKTLSIESQESYNLNIYFKENNLFIRFKNIVINDVKLYNVLGQVIELNIKKSSFLKIKFSGSLETGVYFVKLSTDKGVLNKKVLFKKS